MDLPSTSKTSTNFGDMQVVEDASPIPARDRPRCSAGGETKTKVLGHAEGAAARATGALANESSSHSAGAAELTRDRVSFSLLSKKELDAFEKQFPSFCCPLCTSPLT